MLIAALATLPVPLSRAAEEAPAAPASSASSSRHGIDLAFDSQFSSDIAVMETTGLYRLDHPRTDLALSVGYSTVALDYQPAAFDLISEPRHRTEERPSAQLNLRHEWPSRLTWIAGAGAYEGFTDYRSAWLDEYYRQYFVGQPGYQDADPRGYSLSGGVRWEYWRSAGFAQVEGSFNRDEVSPGYEINLDTGLRRGTDRLYTTAARVTFENIVSRRVRVLNEFQLAKTTEREPRYAYQGSANVALGEHWVWRGVLGLAKEQPQLESLSVGAVLEREWGQRWFLSAVLRFYRDTGQLTNLGLLSSATPPVTTWQAGVGLRWQGERLAVKLVAGPYFTRYDAPGRQSALDVAPFENLYRDRDWFFAQAAVSLSL